MRRMQDYILRGLKISWVPHLYYQLRPINHNNNHIKYSHLKPNSSKNKKASQKIWKRDKRMRLQQLNNRNRNHWVNMRRDWKRITRNLWLLSIENPKRRFQCHKRMDIHYWEIFSKTQLRLKWTKLSTLNALKAFNIQHITQYLLTGKWLVIFFI